jgi:hypothetical protein
MSKQERILFLTPYAHKIRGNVLSTERICNGYRQRGYKVHTLVYTEGLDCKLLQEELKKSTWVHVLHITRFAEWLEQRSCPWQWKRLYRLIPRLKVTIIGECYDADVAEQVQTAIKSNPFLEYKQAVLPSVIILTGKLRLTSVCCHP